MIGHFLLPKQQGFYYTFGSLIAMNILLELGLMGVIVQFASHENAHLQWGRSGVLEGPEIALGRLASLLKISLIWFGAAAALVILLLMPAGMAFFSRDSEQASVVWRFPWFFLTVASAINLMILPLLAVLEGCGKVAHIASLRLAQSVVASAGLWITLISGGALLASPVFEMLEVIVTLVWLGYYYRTFFRQLLERTTIGIPFDWRVEVWPFQWRIAITSLGGYLLSQLFNPILFSARGAEAAGRMGMSLSVAGGLVVIASSWIRTKAPSFGSLVAMRRWKDLDQIFFSTFRQTLLALTILSIITFSLSALLPIFAPAFSQRLLSPLPFAFLLLALLMNHGIYCQAVYLRAHKAEPFVVLTIVTGIVTATSSFFLAKHFGETGVCIGFCACSVAALGASTWIFLRKRRQWHALATDLPALSQIV